MNWLKKLLGGRPMRRESCLFVDQCNGGEVNLYTDTLGRKWMAQSPWALFRVAREDQA